MYLTGMGFMRKLVKTFIAAAFVATLGHAAPAAARSVVSAEIPRGTIVVDTSQRRLYLGLGRGKALSYRVAVGRAGKQWTGTTRIRSKHWKPAWSPTAEIIRENPAADRFLRPVFGSDEMLDAKDVWCVWVRPENLRDAMDIEPLRDRFELTR